MNPARTKQKSQPPLATLRTVLQRIATFAATPLARRLALGLFVLQAVVLVFVVRVGTPPDETNHVQFIEYYANHSLSPVFTDQQPTYNLGDKTREVDYLYHYAMSFVYRALPLSAHGKHMVIRLLTVVLAVVCFLVLANVFRRVGLSPGAITAALLVLSNLPMVLFMSSAINNDVLVWVGMALGVLLLVRLWERPTAVDLVWLFTLAIMGGLVKRNLLVVGMVLGVLGFVVLVRHFRVIVAQLGHLNWHLCVALAVLLLGVALFAERVGGNLVRYGSIVVACEQVRSEAACYDFWANIRARELARQTPGPLMPPHDFVISWTSDSFFNIVDIQTQGWRHEVKPVRWLTPVLVYVLFVGLVYGIFYEKARLRRDQQSRWRLYVVAIALFYIAMQLAVNFATYRHLQVYGVALNGRYIIPSVLLLSGFAGFYWAKLLARRPSVLALMTIALVVATIFGSGLMLLLRNPQSYTG